MIDENRLRRRRELNQRRQRRRWRTAGVLIFVLIGLWVWSPWSGGQRNQAPESGKIKQSGERRSPKDTAKNNVLTPRTFVLFGLDEADGQKRATAAAQIVFDPAKNRISGVAVDSHTYVWLPNRGYRAIADGYVEGAEELQSGVNELAGVKAEGFVSVAAGDFSRLVQAKTVGEFFKNPMETNISRGKLGKYAEELGRIPADRVELSDMPVKAIIIGSQTYYEADQKELDRLVKAIWGKAPKRGAKPKRVIILNGNGTPGIARTAADRLIGKGFSILDLKNAENFNYRTTEVVYYKQADKSVAEKIVKSLGTGRAIENKLAQDVTDIVVVVGRDFK